MDLIEAEDIKKRWQEYKESKVKSLSRVRLFPTPWTVDYQAPSSVGFFQARVLEWIAISFSRGSSRPRNQTWVSCIPGRRFTVWATREAHIEEPYKKDVHDPDNHDGVRSLTYNQTF